MQCLVLHYALFTRPLLPEGSSLQVEILSVCLFVCPSSLQYFQYMAFKSSQNHVRPHILYIIEKRMTSATTMTMTKTHTKTNTKTKTKTNTKRLKDPSHAILLKSR